MKLDQYPSPDGYDVYNPDDRPPPHIVEEMEAQGIVTKRVRCIDAPFSRPSLEINKEYLVKRVEGEWYWVVPVEDPDCSGFGAEYWRFTNL